MPKNVWSYKKKKRTRKTKNASEVEEMNVENNDSVANDNNNGSATASTENLPETCNVINQTKVKQEAQLENVPVQLPIKRPSTALIASFGLLEAQKPSADPPKIKKEPLDEVSKQVSSQMFDENEVEIIGAYKPVKKIKIVNQPIDTGDDIVIVTECTLQKENLNISTKEELCDTAPSSPVSEENGEFNHHTAEELELGNLRLSECSVSAVRNNEPSNDEIIVEDTSPSVARNFDGFNDLNFFDLDSKDKKVDLYNCSQILTVIQKELANFKNKISTMESNFEESIRKSMLKYNCISNTIPSLNPTNSAQNITTIPPFSYGVIREVPSQPKIVKEPVAAVPTFFSNRQHARDLFLQEDGASTTPPLKDLNASAAHFKTSDDNEIAKILKYFYQPKSNNNTQSLPNKNVAHKINKDAQFETSSAYSKDNNPLISDQLGLPALKASISLPHASVSETVNLSHLSATTHALLPNPVNISPFFNTSKSLNEANTKMQPQTSDSYMKNSSLVQPIQASVVTTINGNPNLLKEAAIITSDLQSLNDKMLRKRTCDSLESPMSPFYQTEANNNSVPSDPRRNRLGSTEMPNKIPRYDFSASKKTLPLTSEKEKKLGHLLNSAMVGIETSQSQLNKPPIAKNRLVVEKQPDGKKKIDVNEYLNRYSKESTVIERDIQLADESVNRPIEVITNRFSLESVSKSQHNLMSTNSKSFGHPIPVLSGRGNSDSIINPQNNLTNRFSLYDRTPTLSNNEFTTMNNSTFISHQGVPIPTQFPANYLNQQPQIHDSMFQNFTAPYFNANIPSQTLLHNSSFGGNFRNPLLPTPISQHEARRSPLFAAAVSPSLGSVYSSNSPTIQSNYFHYQSSLPITEQSSPSLALQQSAPVNFVPNLISHDTITTTDNSNSRSNQRRSTALSHKPQKFSSLVPKSVKEDIGKAFIPSSFVYLIMIEWNQDWFLQFETSGEPEHSPPPILPTSARLSQVCNTYKKECDYYNTYFKLLLVESWFKLYQAWKEIQTLPEDRKHIFKGKIHSMETKQEYNKYIIEFFVASFHKEALPKESCIVLLTFKSQDVCDIKMLGYVTKVVNRSFQMRFDAEHDAYKVLSISEKRDHIYKYKVTIYTVYKSDDINDKQMILIQNLFNVRKILQQNDALINVSKSPLYQALLSPITSHNKFSASIPKESKDYSSVMDQVCNRVLDKEPLLAMVHAEFSLPEERMAAVSYLLRKLREKQPGAKVVICSKSEDTLSAIASNLKKHNPVYINKDKINNLQNYSLAKLMEERMSDLQNADANSSEDAVKTKRKVRNDVLSQSDVILLLLLGLENEEYSVMSLIKEFDIACCILDEANNCTEPESIIPLTFGIKKFILFGNKNLRCEASPFTHTYEFSRSLLNRASL